MMTKDDLERRDESWRYIAQEKGYRCTVCGDIPPYGERDVYFETKLCGYHAHTQEKDD